MADFLTVDNTAVEIDTESGDLDFDEIGDRERAIDGTLLVDVEAVKRTWKLTTRELSPTDMAALMADVLTPGVEHTVNGMMTGSLDVQADIKHVSLKTYPSGEDIVQQLSFECSEI